MRSPDGARRLIGRLALLVALLLGLSLMTINAVGYGARYTVPVGAARVPEAAKAGVALTEPLTKGREQDAAYFARLARDVHLRMAEYWGHTDRVALTDNWILNVAGLFLPTYKRYEFVNPDRALRRGYGLCSQDANVLFGELRRSGFQPKNVLLPQHTVVSVLDRRGHPFILDGLYGVVIPYSYSAIRKDPRLVYPYYRRVTLADAPDGQHGASLARVMVRVFSTRSATVNTGTATPHTSFIEPIAYVLKWTIPAVLMGLALIPLLVRPIIRRRGRRRLFAGHAGTRMPV
jgi:hypothetical protein